MLNTLNNGGWLWYVLMLWVLPWKGVALWKAAKRSDQWWFIALLVLNTLAILEILYIFIWSKRPLKAPVKELKAEA